MSIRLPFKPQRTFLTCFSIPTLHGTSTSSSSLPILTNICSQIKQINILTIKKYISMFKHDNTTGATICFILLEHLRSFPVVGTIVSVFRFVLLCSVVLSFVFLCYDIFLLIYIFECSFEIISLSFKFRSLVHNNRSCVSFFVFNCISSTHITSL